MATAEETLSAFRALHYSAAKLADLITGGIDDAEVRSQVRAACLRELAWFDALLAAATLRLTDAEREAIGTAARIAGAVGESDVKAALRAFLERNATGGGA